MALWESSLKRQLCNCWAPVKQEQEQQQPPFLNETFTLSLFLFLWLTWAQKKGERERETRILAAAFSSTDLSAEKGREREEGAQAMSQSNCISDRAISSSFLIGQKRERGLVTRCLTVCLCQANSWGRKKCPICSSRLALGETVLDSPLKQKKSSLLHFV